MKSERGFTLPELLIASVLLLVLVGVTLLLLRPQNNDAEHRNAERRLELAQIMQAIHKYEADTGRLPPHIATEETIIATQNEESTLCEDLVPKYLDDFPHDPSSGLALDETMDCTDPNQIFISGYAAQTDGAGKVILTAPDAENGENITVEKWFPIL